MYRLTAVHLYNSFLAIQSSRIKVAIVDESHHLLQSDGFRPTIQTAIIGLRKAGIPRVLLTATLPISIVPTFIKKAHLDQKHIVIRASTQRAEIGWALLEKASRSRASYKEIMMLATSMEHEVFQTEQDRGIIFVRNKRDAELMEEHFGVPAYFAGVADRDLRATNWRNGTNSWIVATTAFVSGVDYASVRVVIFFEPLDGMMDMVQGAGRVGRNGLPGYVFVVQSDALASVPDDLAHDYELKAANNKWLCNTTACRRQDISVNMDGKGTKCGDRKDDVLCDICDPKALVYQKAKQALSIPAVRDQFILGRLSAAEYISRSWHSS